MRYSLRTLVVVMLLGGPLCAWGWSEWQRDRRSDYEKEVDAIIEQLERDAKMGRSNKAAFDYWHAPIVPQQTISEPPRAGGKYFEEL
jgi:hypothetical protein